MHIITYKKELQQLCSNYFTYIKLRKGFFIITNQSYCNFLDYFFLKYIRSSSSVYYVSNLKELLEADYDDHHDD